MKHLVIGQRLKTPSFSAFHWSPCGSLVSIGQNFVTTRVVHLPKRPETSLVTESDQSEPNHRLLHLCTACTAWSDSDRAVHSCISWFVTDVQMRCMDWWQEILLYYYYYLFESYQDDGRVIQKGCVQWNPSYHWKDSRLQPVSKPGPLYQQAALNILGYRGSCSNANRNVCKGFITAWQNKLITAAKLK